MRKLFCRVCEDHKEIDHYDHDEPILKCGHVFEETDADKIIKIATRMLLPEIYKVMREKHISYIQAEKIVIFG